MSRKSGSIMLGAFKAKGYRKVAAEAGPHKAMRGSINYIVFRAPCHGKMGYHADVRASGVRRNSSGYRLRNEGTACATNPRVAIEKAVKLYFTARSQKRRGSPVRNAD